MKEARLRIDLTRMECKDKKTKLIEAQTERIDLTRMECKVPVVKAIL